MTTTAFLALMGIWLAAIISPGPDIVQITRMGARSRRSGMWTALGIMTGNAVWIIASLAGLSALISSHPQVLAILQLGGGSYLAYLGIQSVRGGWALRRDHRQGQAVDQAVDQRLDAAAAPTTSAPSDVRSWWTGVATNLANPKAVVFFGSVFAQFIEPDMGLNWIVILALTLILTGVAWFAGFALAVDALAGKLAKNSAIIDMVTGAIFIGLAIWMLVEGITALVS